MAYEDYAKAVKLGKKDYQDRLLHKELPTLECLDDIIHVTKASREVSLGLVNIPLELVVGTKTAARSAAFAHNFMPILDITSEFATKWITLSIAQEEEGIHDAIVAYEYMNKFYVLEGNKRASVLKYYGSDSIAATVTRILPPQNDDLENQIYYEFVDFYELTEINYIYFSKLGSFAKLLEEVKGDSETPWSDEDKMDFKSIYYSFKDTFDMSRKTSISEITIGDAFLAFINIYGYKNIVHATNTELKKYIEESYEEYNLIDKQNVDLVMTTTPKKDNILTKVLPILEQSLKVCFIHEKTSASSSWTYSHELGRTHIESEFSDKVTTSYYDNVTIDTIEDTINNAIEDGCDVIFTTSPAFSQASLKAAIENPSIIIMNCALHDPHSYMRTYYARMHEAKYIIGAIAGVMAQNDTIAYIADYPIYGTISNINAFALGVKLTNPRANIHLLWSSKKDENIDTKLNEINPDCVSNRDLSVPESGLRTYGLYMRYPDHIWNLAIPVYNWGIFYQDLIDSIMDGRFKSIDSKNTGAINYWWGMEENVIDIITSPWLPDGVKRLSSLLQKTICSGDFNPFSGIIYSQDKTIRNGEDQTLSPNDIITMDWLSDNIIGSIPTLDDLEDTAKPVTLQQGVKVEKE